jgi:hypothetical protein
MLQDMDDFLQAVQHVLTIGWIIALWLAAIRIDHPIEQRQHESFAGDPGIAAGVMCHILCPAPGFTLPNRQAVLN